MNRKSLSKIAGSPVNRFLATLSAVLAALFAVVFAFAMHVTHSPTLVPGHPQTAVIRAYRQEGTAVRLARTVTVRNGQTVATLAEDLNSLRPVLGNQSCPNYTDNASWADVRVTFEYADGSRLTVVVSAQNCRDVFGSGHAAVGNDALFRELNKPLSTRL